MAADKPCPLLQNSLGSVGLEGQNHWVLVEAVRVYDYEKDALFTVFCSIDVKSLWTVTNTQKKKKEHQIKTKRHLSEEIKFALGLIMNQSLFIFGGGGWAAELNGVKGAGSMTTKKRIIYSFLFNRC